MLPCTKIVSTHVLRCRGTCCATWFLTSDLSNKHTLTTHLMVSIVRTLEALRYQIKFDILNWPWTSPTCSYINGTASCYQLFPNIHRDPWAPRLNYHSNYGAKRHTVADISEKLHSTWTRYVFESSHAYILCTVTDYMERYIQYCILLLLLYLHRMPGVLTYCVRLDNTVSYSLCSVFYKVMCVFLCVRACSASLYMWFKSILKLPSLRKTIHRLICRITGNISVHSACAVREVTMTWLHFTLNNINSKPDCLKLLRTVQTT